jgi:hypothetical protein
MELYIEILSHLKEKSTKIKYCYSKFVLCYQNILWLKLVRKDFF